MGDSCEGVLQHLGHVLGSALSERLGGIVTRTHAVLSDGLGSNLASIDRSMALPLEPLCAIVSLVIKWVANPYSEGYMRKGSFSAQKGEAHATAHLSDGTWSS